MKSLRSLLNALAVLLLALSVPFSARADLWMPESGFVSLFNGKDLTGWGYRDKEQKILETFDGKFGSSDGRFSAVPTPNVSAARVKAS